MISSAPGRFHLLLTSAGRPVQHGWWDSEPVARQKFTRWVGEYGSMPNARIALTDEETGSELTSWPDPA